MPEIIDVKLPELLLDTSNARLPKEQSSQQDALLAMAKEQGDKVLRLAEDIRRHGLDPLRPIAVRPADEAPNRYTVVEGNRRITALKALESPATIEPALDVSGRRKLARIVAQPQAVPIEPLRCIVFRGENELDALDRWVTLLHTGENEGVGLVAWRADERDRHLSRRGGGTLGGQVLEFLRTATGKEYRAETSKKGFMTTVTRLVSNPKVRQHLGLALESGRLTTWYPRDEVIKGLEKIVDDLTTGRENSRSLHGKKDRERYIEQLSSRALPNRSKRLSAPIPLSAAAISVPAPTGASASTRRSRVQDPAARRHLIPRGCQLNVSPARIHRLYNELAGTELEKYPNLCAVGLRVFVELSVDHYISVHRLIEDKTVRNTPLAKRMKTASAHLVRHKNMPSQLSETVRRIADADSIAVPSAAVPTMHAYVHSKYAFPTAPQLREAWDELQPFFEYLWA